MIRLKLLANIPRELNDLSILNPNELLLAADESVYLVKIPKEKISRVEIKELFRWTGTNIISIDAYSNKIIAGTNKGVIIFNNNKAKPVWVGYPCNVFGGKFSNKIDIICLAKSPHKMSRILDIFAFSSIDVESGYIKSLKGTEEEIVYFSINIGPIQEFAFKRIKNLAVKLDIDMDGYLELVLITPDRAPKLSIIDIVDEMIRRIEYELPSFVGNPILLDYRDINGDGEKELYVVSMLNDFEAVISALSVSENEISVSVLTKIDIRDLYGEDISDDGVLYAFLGQFDNDGLPEIVGIWEEPCDNDSFMSRIMPFKVDFLGRIILPERADQEEVTIKKILVTDIDSDSLLELIIFHESGFSIYKVTNHKFAISKISEFRFPIFIKLLSRSDRALLVSGPTSTELDSPWSLLKVNLDSGKIGSVGVFPRLFKMECSGKARILAKSDKRFFIISENCVKEIRNSIDASIVNEEILSIIKDRGLSSIKISAKNCRVYKRGIDKSLSRGVFIKDVNYNAQIGILNDKELFIYNPRKKSLRKIKLLTLPHNWKESLISGYMYRKKNRIYLVLIYKNCIQIVNNKRKTLISKDVPFDDFLDLFLLEEKTRKHELVVLFTRKRELYKFELFKGTEKRLGLDNLTSLVIDKKAKKILVAFRNNWIAEYEFREVLCTEDEESNN